MSKMVIFHIALVTILVLVSVEGNTIKPKHTSSAALESSFTANKDVTDKWEAYKTKYYKKYNNEEDQKRFKTYLDNKNKIKEHNAKYKTGLTSYDMSENQFSDWTNEEYRRSLSWKSRELRESSQQLEEEWGAFKAKYNKKYNSTEDKERFNIYLESKRKIEAHNADYEKGLTTYRQGLNALADLTLQELSARLGFRRP